MPNGAEPGRREATKERNREAILAAGLEVFSQQGYGSATIRDLIRASGLSTGTFYNYFPDKESVLRALVERSAVRLREVLRTAREQAHSADEFVESFRVLFAFMAEDPTFFALLSRNSGTLRNLLGDPVLGSVVDELVADMRSKVASGELPEFDVDLMGAAMAGVSLELGLAMIEREGTSVDEVARFAEGLFLGGIERLSSP